MLEKVNTIYRILEEDNNCYVAQLHDCQVVINKYDFASPQILSNNLLEKKCSECNKYIGFLTWLLMEKKMAVVLHAAGVRNKQGKYILFCGQAGAGKSTIFNLLKGEFSGIHEETIFVKMNNHFSTSTWSFPQGLAMPLSKGEIGQIYFLVGHSVKNSIQPVPFEEAFALLMKSLNKTYYFNSVIYKTLFEKDSVAYDYIELLKSVPVYKLSFKPDMEIVDLINENWGNNDATQN